MKTEFQGGDLQFYPDGKIGARVVAQVKHTNTLPNGFSESVLVTVLIDDAGLTIGEIEAAAIEKANNLLREATADLEEIDEFFDKDVVGNVDKLFLPK